MRRPHLAHRAPVVIGWVLLLTALAISGVPLAAVLGVTGVVAIGYGLFLVGGEPTLRELEERSAAAEAGLDEPAADELDEHHTPAVKVVDYPTERVEHLREIANRLRFVEHSTSELHWRLRDEAERAHRHRIQMVAVLVPGIVGVLMAVGLLVAMHA